MTGRTCPARSRPAPGGGVRPGDRRPVLIGGVVRGYIGAYAEPGRSCPPAARRGWPTSPSCWPSPSRTRRRATNCAAGRIAGRAPPGRDARRAGRRTEGGVHRRRGRGGPVARRRRRQPDQLRRRYRDAHQDLRDARRPVRGAGRRAVDAGGRSRGGPGRARPAGRRGSTTGPSCPGRSRPGTVAQGFGQCVAAPIVIDGALWGLISAFGEADEDLPPGSEPRLADFTSLMASAIANAQARDELRGLAEQQGEALRRVATLVAQQAPQRRSSTRSPGEASRALGVARVGRRAAGTRGGLVTLLGSTGGRPGRGCWRPRRSGGQRQGRRAGAGGRPGRTPGYRVRGRGPAAADEPAIPGGRRGGVRRAGRPVGRWRADPGGRQAVGRHRGARGGGPARRRGDQADRLHAPGGQLDLQRSRARQPHRLTRAHRHRER